MHMTAPCGAEEFGIGVVDRFPPPRFAPADPTELKCDLGRKERLNALMTEILG